MPYLLARAALASQTALALGITTASIPILGRFLESLSTGMLGVNHSQTLSRSGTRVYASRDYPMSDSGRPSRRTSGGKRERHRRVDSAAEILVTREVKVLSRPKRAVVRRRESWDHC